MSRFKVGDRVVIVRSPCAEVIGTVTTITSELRKVALTSDWVLDGHLKPDALIHVLEEPSRAHPGKHLGYPPEYLEPLPDDSSEKSTWAELPEWARRACGRKERV